MFPPLEGDYLTEDEAAGAFNPDSNPTRLPVPYFFFSGVGVGFRIFFKPLNPDGTPILPEVIVVLLFSDIPTECSEDEGEFALLFLLALVTLATNPFKVVAFSFVG